MLRKCKIEYRSVVWTETWRLKEQFEVGSFERVEVFAHSGSLGRRGRNQERWCHGPVGVAHRISSAPASAGMQRWVNPPSLVSFQGVSLSLVVRGPGWRASLHFPAVTTDSGILLPRDQGNSPLSRRWSLLWSHCHLPLHSELRAGGTAAWSAAQWHQRVQGAGGPAAAGLQRAGGWEHLHAKASVCAQAESGEMSSV